jgi:hypothetical protein
MNWKNAYKSLVAVRRWLNVLIDYARAKAYPATGGKRKRQHQSENVPTLP